ncbi:LutC/YkgG family protein [Roseospirillum parvum]|uniref:L-lactate dehydrogenase complex protein LldG n=1 Tax=Roseospirillum parvum TaxID=83401 RepID=A0A1G8DPG3_9PROT|nr:LUD domain-containing protein [Roseospirillum parvum]SDH59613.1 L-lactate dehydrogenase complex protein LldG [Roseospirillum parvum]
MTAKPDPQRQNVLAAVRRGLARTGPAAAPVWPVEPPLIPAAARGDGDLIARFTAAAEAAAASVERVAGPDALGPAVAAWLTARNLPGELAVAPDPALDPAAAHGLLTVRRGTAGPGDLIALTRARLGIAETGSLLLTSSPETPTGLNFLPDFHLVALDASAVVATLEDAWARLRQDHAGGWPRTVNLVAGPSRTGDIEQTIQLGAHGPRHLHILLVESR